MRTLLLAAALAAPAAAQDFAPDASALVAQGRATIKHASYQGPGQRPGCSPQIAEQRALDAIRFHLKPGATAELRYSLQQSSAVGYVMFYYSPAFDSGSGPAEVIGGVTLDQFCGSVYVGPATSVSAKTVKY